MINRSKFTNILKLISNKTIIQSLEYEFKIYKYPTVINTQTILDYTQSNTHNNKILNNFVFFFLPQQHVKVKRNFLMKIKCIKKKQPSFNMLYIENKNDKDIK